MFLLASVGFVWVRAGSEHQIEFVTRPAMILGVPPLIFTTLMRSEIDPAVLTELTLAAIVGYAALTVVFYAALRLLQRAVRTCLAPLIYGNTGNIGLPLALVAFGEAGPGYAVMVFAVSAIRSFTIGVRMAAGGGSPIRRSRNLWSGSRCWAGCVSGRGRRHRGS